MPSNYGTNLAQAFASKALEIFYETSVADDITNRDYEGEIKGRATIVNVLEFAAQDWQTYTGATITPTAVQEIKGQLATNQQLDYYFQVLDITRLQSWIKNPEGTIIEQLGKRLKERVDAYILSQYTDVASGNRIGTNYTTGTVAVATGTGVVTGSGTTFTAAMVGRGFKAAGHSVWYTVSAYTSATSITIVNDTQDDVASGTYTGGTIGGGATYVLEAATPVALSASNVDSYVIKMRSALKKAKVWDHGTPWLVVSTDVYSMMLQSTIAFTPYTPSSFENVIQKAIVGMYRGFKVYESQQVQGDNTNGYHCLGGINAWKTMAEALVEAEEEPFLAGNFGRGYKGLFVYGQKTLDERRKCATELFATA
jgi:hypothetical protein